jgi:hypothetical protein
MLTSAASHRERDDAEKGNTTLQKGNESHSNSRIVPRILD